MNKQSISSYLVDDSISLKAKGLLTQMLQLNDDLSFTIEKAKEVNSDGKNSIRSAVMELMSHGYLVRKKTSNKFGQYTGYEYRGYPNPQEIK